MTAAAVPMRLVQVAEAPDEQWSAEAYFANLFDRNAVIFTNTGNYDHRETTNEPCVFGIRLSYGFGKKG